MILDIWQLMKKKECSSLKDRKSTRLNSSHANISYAVFCLKKKIHLPPTNPRVLIRHPSFPSSDAPTPLHPQHHPALISQLPRNLHPLKPTVLRSLLIKSII